MNVVSQHTMEQKGLFDSTNSSQEVVAFMTGILYSNRNLTALLLKKLMPMPTSLIPGLSNAVDIGLDLLLFWCRAPILAPLHLLPRRGSPLVSFRGGDRGMPQATAYFYTALESLFLYRGIFKRGCKPDAFEEVSGILINNPSVKSDGSYDAARLRPELLQQLFLQILRDEAREEHDVASRADGGLSPTTKKRKLAPATRPVDLKDARQYLERVPAILQKLNKIYADSALAEIRKLDEEVEAATRDIERLEAAKDRAEKERAALEAERSSERKNQAPNQVSEVPEVSRSEAQQPVLLPRVNLTNGFVTAPSVPQPFLPQPVPVQASETLASAEQSTVSTPVPPVPEAPLPHPLPPAPSSHVQAKAADAAAGLLESGVARIKNEEATPRAPDEAGYTAADDKVAGNRSSNHAKRKREDSSPPSAQEAEDGPPEASTEAPTGGATDHQPPHTTSTDVFWTRNFNKICATAMEQIVHHRYANMFANPIREKDAPGYDKIILQPQDLKSIRAALSFGNRAAAAAATALPGGDPGTSVVRLPASADLVPPRSIINAKQLERELSHIFANAIMYNPDAGHGPGARFLRDAHRDEADVFGIDHLPPETVAQVLHQQSAAAAAAAAAASGTGSPGYKVDEFAVVNHARSMFSVVQKLLNRLASSPKANKSTTRPRHASTPAGAAGADDAVAGPPATTGEGAEGADGGVEDDDGEEGGATETENAGQPAPKRRRTMRKSGPE
ncbi:hypothetical protein P8C59_005765 [Phyllachora maydis]|uniref:Bromo domain-containing protein n=1 Tax=Phyllachora maydis TaxID=1825666 RepID=A0AAD9I549_9PEZI|nr:hypothetical protein P8C59_005765 [Phyllachora maydis]